MWQKARSRLRGALAKSSSPRLFEERTSRRIAVRKWCGARASAAFGLAFRRAISRWTGAIALIACGLAPATSVRGHAPREADPDQPIAHLSGRMLQPRLSAAFDPLSRKTRLSSDLPNHLCFALELPLEWQATSDGNARFAAPALGAELEIALRSADELPRLAQPDLASRDATVLLDAHEQALGRPAQAVSLTPLSLAGASRWTATWSDPNLPTPSGSLTVETFIVVLDKDWLAELTISNVEARGIYEWLVQEMLSGFEARSAETCGRRE